MSELVESLPICQCGCGFQVTKKENKFISGHNTRGTKKSQKTRERMSKAQKKRFQDPKQHHTGSYNPNWKGGISSVTKVCECCGINYQSHLFGKSKYCSRKCQGLSQRGKKSWAKGLTSDPTKPNYDPRISKGLSGKNNPMYGRTGNLNPSKRPEVRAKISIANSGSKNGMWVSFEERICVFCNETFSIKKNSKRKYCSKVCSRKATKIRMKINNPMKNPITVQKQNRALKKRWERHEHPNKGKRRPDQSRRWKRNNPVWKPGNLIKAIEGQKRKPNKLEKKFIKFLKENTLPFNYTGDGKFFITVTGKPNKIVRNPDFVYEDVTKKQILIEIGCEYRHPKDSVNAMLTQYQKVGWKALYFSQKEFYNSPEKIKEIILNALG